MERTNWKTAVAFHGHECPGLAIGVRACEAAMSQMNLGRAADEELLCISETDACSIDAVQALTGCTLGKGNLILKNRGKQAFTFLNRSRKEAMRFYLKQDSGRRSREEFLDYLLTAPLEELFLCQRVPFREIPKARRFPSDTCECCKETTGEYWLRLENGKKVCLDCFTNYEREEDE